MFMRGSIRIGRKIAAAIVLAIVYVPGATGQVTSTDGSEPATEQAPEEIVVYGEKSLIVLRNELYRAQEDFFTVFNSLNSTNDFDIKCNKITFLGARRRVHRCLPNFAIRYEAQASADMMIAAYAHQFEAMDYSDNVDTAIGVLLRKKDKELWAEFASLVLENPDLQQELVELRNANRALEVERQRK
jgi:hypothetical protein